MPDNSPASDLRAEFGNRVRVHRQALGVSQEDFAGLVGLDRTYISSVERGNRNVSLENICRLATALHVDAGELVKGLTLRPKQAGD